MKIVPSNSCPLMAWYCYYENKNEKLEIFTWFEDNFGRIDNNSHYRLQVHTEDEDGNGYFMIGFNHAGDSMAFKLRWS